MLYFRFDRSKLYFYKFSKFLQNLIKFYFSLGREHCEINIIIFNEVLDHIAHIDRVLSSPGGSLLLAGRSGVGRRTAVKLVSHMHSMETITPHISRNYTIKHFRNDLKQVSHD